MMSGTRPGLSLSVLIGWDAAAGQPIHSYF